MNQEQIHIIKRLGLDPDDTTLLLEGFDAGEDAINWFLGEGWPADWDAPTEADREALIAYITKGN